MTNTRKKLGSSADEIDLFDVYLYECWERQSEGYKKRHTWEQFRAEVRAAYDKKKEAEDRE